MRIIFLDIDGVLCTVRSHFAYGIKGSMMLDWDPTCAALVRRLCERTGAKIVISSTWRHKPHHPDLFARLRIHNLMGHLIASPEGEDDDWRTERIGSRGVEIADWMQRHPEVTAYVILDDSTDMLPTQQKNLVLTEFEDGFSSKDFTRANEILGGETLGVVLL